MEWADLERELRREGVADQAVLAAMSRVSRDLFVPPEARNHAWRNIPLPIGHGQTISQPLVVGMMTQALELKGSEKVLEVGTGSGYQCAVLAELSRQVISIERLDDLATESRDRLARLGYSQVQVVVGDGTHGYPEEAPYDAIIVTAASPKVPAPLLDQLAEQGRLIAPVGSHSSQELVLYRRIEGKLVSSRMGPVRFVPLIGEHGWRESDISVRFPDGW